MKDEITICREAAKSYAGRDWHSLNSLERTLIYHLEKANYISPKFPADGFVGKATDKGLSS